LRACGGCAQALRHIHVADDSDQTTLDVHDRDRADLAVQHPSDALGSIGFVFDREYVGRHEACDLGFERLQTGTEPLVIGRGWLKKLGRAWIRCTARSGTPIPRPRSAKAR
jgi:hypothetical protein